MKRLQDKVAIITGAGSGTGMGAVIARVFASEGAVVVATGTPTANRTLTHWCRTSPPRAIVQHRRSWM